MKSRIVTCLLVAGAGLAMVLAVHVLFIFNNIWSWRITVVAAEYGHRFAMGAFLLAWIGWRRRAKFTAIAGVAAAAVLLWPLVQAISVSRKLPEDLRRTFGATRAADARPLDIVSLCIGTWRTNLKPEPLVYAEDAAGQRRIDFFRSKSVKPAPCIVLLHGGGWERGEVNELPDWSTHWAQNGYAVASVQYRFAPQHPWPAQDEDVRLALAYLKANAASLGIDPTRFVFFGRSAGAQIAVACAYGMHDPAVRGCVSFYGPQDMFFARKYSVEDDVLNSLRMVRNFMGGDPEQAEKNYTAASGMLLARSDSPPALIFHGSHDVIVWNRHSQRFAAKLDELGVSHLYLELPWAAHGFDWCYDGVGSQLARYSLDCFLEAVTR
ncbi:MAG: alpha/beta hydrolase [Verrucomicrobia bacterium]|nr:alpha/beta hydrolase [Verrucomicrobiota bacterium]